jgi:hypothetical protein
MTLVMLLTMIAEMYVHVINLYRTKVTFAVTQKTPAGSGLKGI